MSEPAQDITALRPRPAAALPSPPASRVFALDGLRGVAALIVVIAHSYNALTLPLELRWQIAHSPLALLLSSNGAVQLFFVLSGYVLCGSLERTQGAIGVAQFYVRRVFRIHPPYLAALGFAWLASFFHVATPAEHAQGLSSMVMQVHLGATELLRACLFPGRAEGQLPVGWTLTVEMIFSLLLPLMLVFARRLHWTLLVAVSLVVLHLVESVQPFGYAIDFALGIATWQERERIARFMGRLSKTGAALWIVAALVVFSAPMLLWSEPMMGIYFVHHTPLNVTVLGIGSVALVIGALTLPSLRRALEWRPVQVLGRLSFSLYLVHFTLILLIMRIVERPTTLASASLFFAIIITCSVLLSEVSYRLVEQPSIRLGSRLCRAIEARR